MEQPMKNVQGFRTPFGKGYVIDADTPEERRLEINSFYVKEWIPDLLELNEKLEAMNPNYELTQLKIKFGELTMYVAGIPDEGRLLINDLARKFYFQDNPQRKVESNG